MPGDTMKIGNARITMVKDMPAMRGDPRVMWANIDPSEFTTDDHKHWFNERGLADITIGSVLVRSSRQNILIDTGIGRGDRAPFRTERADLLGNLVALGLGPE